MHKFHFYCEGAFHTVVRILVDLVFLSNQEPVQFFIILQSIFSFNID